MSKLIVLRGLPGSGKSALAAALALQMNGVVASVDHYFERTGEYKFRLSDVPHSYGFVQGQVDAFMQAGKDVVIADGVHMYLKDIESYQLLAAKYNYELEIKYPEIDTAFDPQQCYEHSSHHVPLYVIRNIAKRFQREEAIAA